MVASNSLRKGDIIGRPLWPQLTRPVMVASNSLRKGDILDFEGKPRIIAKITENITNRKKSFQIELRDLVGTGAKFVKFTPDERVESA